MIQRVTPKILKSGKFKGEVLWFHPKIAEDPVTVFRWTRLLSALLSLSPVLVQLQLSCHKALQIISKCGANFSFWVSISHLNS